MTADIFEIARQSGATDEHGKRPESVFCFTREELKDFSGLLAEMFSQRCEDIASKYQKTAYFPFISGKRDGALECAEDLKKNFGIND